MSDESKKPEKIRMEDVLGSDLDDESDSDRIEVVDAGDPAPADQGEGVSVPSGGPAPSLSSIEEELKTAIQEKDMYHDLWIRARADFDNYQKRVQRESDDQRRMAGADLMERVLPVLDNLQRALADESDGPAFREGIALIAKQLTESLAAVGLEPIEAVGAPFDPIYHEAVATQTDSGRPPNTVLEEVKKGYMFKGRVLRHSMVRVAVAPEAEKGAGGEEPKSR